MLHEERFHEALAALRDVVKQDPKNPYAYYFLGVGLYEVGELEAAHAGALARPGGRRRALRRGHGVHGARRERRGAIVRLQAEATRLTAG